MCFMSDKQKSERVPDNEGENKTFKQTFKSCFNCDILYELYVSEGRNDSFLSFGLI